MSDAPDLPDLSGALETVEEFLLGERPSLNRIEVCEQSGVPVETATRLWRLMGFPTTADDDVAFTPADVAALRFTDDLIRLGILSDDRQSALVRTWGRSYARLAEWQTSLLADVALSSDNKFGADPVEAIAVLTEQVLPRVEKLQNYVWRRHLASASSRLMAGAGAGGATSMLAVGFIDIVGFTSQSKVMDESDLVAWIEHFEDECAGLAVDLGGRIIKNIGDEVLYVCDDVSVAAEIALRMTARGSDAEDSFPEVRAGVAYGEVVSRLGDVFGPTVNIASRLTSVARPGSVLVDENAHAALVGDDPTTTAESDERPPTNPPSVDNPFVFRRMPRTSVKGYHKLQPWVLRRA